MLKNILLLAALSFFPYFLNFDGDFVFDDSEAIVKNEDVHGDFWMKAFVDDFWGQDIQSNRSHKSYRPLSILSFRLNYILSGEKLHAPDFKITNITCHTICCLLMWRMFRVLLKDINRNDKGFWSRKAYLSALLFAVHPIHAECVAGIVGRADILAAILFCLSFHAYCKARTTVSRKKYILHLLETINFAGLSMLCKENGVTVLGFCICCDIANKFLRKHPTINYYFEVNFGRVFFLTTGIFILVYGRWMIMGGTKPVFQPIDNPAAFEENPFKKVMTFQYIYFLNALLLIWPQWLCYDWSMGCVPVIKGLNDYRLVFVALLYVYGYLLLKHIRSKSYNITRRQIFLGASLIVVPFLPAANIFYPVGFVVAERILYIPSAGFCLLVVIGLSKIIERKKFRKTGQFFYCLLIITFTLKTWHRSSEWRTEHNLFVSGLSVCNLNAKVHYNAARVADARQQTDWALAEYKEALRLFPKYYQAMNNLANVLKNLKQYDEAESYLRKAVSTKVDFPAAWMNLGIVLAHTKRYNESQDAYQIALKYRKKYPDCYYNLGYLNLELNQTQKALDYFFEAINLNPKHNLAWTNILALLDNTGKILEANNIIPIALKELGDSPSVNFAIANIYGKMERYEDAEKHFLKAIKLFGDQIHPIHYSNLGVLYHRWKKYELAKKMYENSLKIDPTFPSALQNLKNIKNYLKLKSVLVET